MPRTVQGILSVIGRVLLCTIFLMSAVGNKIPNFSKVAELMASVGIPAPQVMLAGAIAFLIAGSLSVVLGYQSRIGASLLLVFLILATYYFHAFWKAAEPQARTGADDPVHEEPRLDGSDDPGHRRWHRADEPGCQSRG